MYKLYTEEEGKMTKEERMRFHEMQAYWWMHSASNGHAKQRKMYHGFSGGPEFTDQEKVDDAMETSQTHMRLFMEVAENWDGKTVGT